MEFINGEIHLLASPSVRHQELLGRLHLIFVDSLKDKTCKPFLAPFDVHFWKKDLEVPDVMQPDLLVVCDLEGTMTEQGRYMGTPTLVLEIASNSTSSKDMIEKLNTYRLSGVKEYWIVDPKQENILLYFFSHSEVDAYRTYGIVQVAQSKVFPSLSMSVQDLFSGLL